jgi:hypothetical protein
MNSISFCGAGFNGGLFYLTPFIPLSFKERGGYKKREALPLYDSPSCEMVIQGMGL